MEKATCQDLEKDIEYGDMIYHFFGMPDVYSIGIKEDNEGCYISVTLKRKTDFDFPQTYSFMTGHDGLKTCLVKIEVIGEKVAN